MNDSPLSVILESATKISAEICQLSCKVLENLGAPAHVIAEARRRADEMAAAEALAKANEAAAMEATPFDVMLEKLAAFEREVRSITRQEAAMFWGEDARLLEQKVAARQREIIRAMEDESARQAMKRRKMMHDDGHFPDSILLAGKRA